MSSSSSSSSLPSPPSSSSPGIIPLDTQPPPSYQGRRSVVLGKKGICCTSQPLASAIGINILSNGGNAADACVAMAAALNVLEPCSTGIGGDAFCLYYDAKTKHVSCLQGNGASGAALSLELLASKGFAYNTKPLDKHHGICITVPGAAALWEDLIIKHGNKDLKTVLSPAIELARDGFPIGPITAVQWAGDFLQGDEALRVLRPNGKNPIAGEILKNPDLANTFEKVASLGAREGFYKGTIGDAIVDAIQSYGGIITKEDLEEHRTAFEEPISCEYKGLRIYETPPPTHGLAALITLSLLDELSPGIKDTKDRSSVHETHLGVECMRLGYADALRHVADPRYGDIPIDALLSKDYIKQRAKLVTDNAYQDVDAGDPYNIETSKAFQASDTVYFCCIDGEGNGCSFINSNYLGFGSGIMPKGTGFCLHNRGHNFSLIPGHPNVAAPRKRPYHTIIPGLATRISDNSLYCTFGNMGGFMQPQGHVQLIRNLVDFGMDPQSAIDSPRWYICGAGEKQDASDVKTSIIKLEDGYGGKWDGNTSNNNDNGEGMCRSLSDKGHKVEPLVTGHLRALYGRAQCIVRTSDGILWGGSDSRCDGTAAVVV